VQSVRKELRLTLALALPMIMGQVSQMLIGITDAAMIGRVGTVELAASAFCQSVFGIFFIIGIGLLMPVGVFTARDHGAGDLTGCAAWLKHGRIMALVAGAGAFLLLWGLSTQLHRFGQPVAVVAVARPFFLLISLSLIPVLYFQAQRQYLEAMGRPWVGTFIMLADVGLNVFLNWVFIWGHWGVPAMGLTGSGVATLLARTLAVTTISFWIRREQAPATGLEWRRFRAMLVMGVPAAVSLLFEIGAFSVAALLMGTLGAVALAAHQVALSCAAFTFMVPLGLSMAVSIRVSKASGEGRGAAVRPIVFGVLGLTVLIMGTTALVFTLGGGWLARAFTPDLAVVALATHLLVVAAIFQLFDGSQVVAIGALRGLQDVRVPTIITFVAYWIVALPLAYFLAMHTALGPIGVWVGLAGGLACAAMLLITRFVRKTG
jgi:multidrug resistance protein, MATE family